MEAFKGSTPGTRQGPQRFVTQRRDDRDVRVTPRNVLQRL